MFGSAITLLKLFAGLFVMTILILSGFMLSKSQPSAEPIRNIREQTPSADYNPYQQSHEIKMMGQEKQSITFPRPGR